MTQLEVWASKAKWRWHAIYIALFVVIIIGSSFSTGV